MIKLSRQLLSLLLFLTVVVAAQAQYTETKEFQKRFAVEPETAIEISNKYGKVELVTWDKDSVLFDIRMKVEERKMNRLDRTLNNIDFDFTSSSHYLIARTIVDKNKSQLEAEFQRFKETLLQADGTIEIDYKVWVPANNSLKVENKFGDIYIGDYNGTITIGLSNGKLKAHDLTNQATIKLNFADASINSMKKGRIFTNYSDFYLKNAEDVRISSKSSEIEIIESKSLTIDSRRDKFRLRQSEQIEADASFTSFRLNKLIDRGTFRFAYGDLGLEQIAPDFSDLYIQSRTTDVSLFFSPEAKFNFELTEDKVDVTLGRELKQTDKEVIDSKNGSNRIKGYFKQETDEKHKVHINATAGSVRIFSN